LEPQWIRARHSDDVPTTPALGDVLEIDDRTVLVFGQALDVAHDKPDAANALAHRAGSTPV
jgi:hypothetical protein